MIQRTENCTCHDVFLNTGLNRKPVGIEWNDLCEDHGVGTEYFRNMKTIPFGFKRELKTSRGIWLMTRIPERISSQPVQTCQLCGRHVIVTPDGRGFPPDIAKRKLKKICNANDCDSDSKYTAGFVFYNNKEVEIS